MKIAVDHENVKWLLTRSGRLWSYNGENWTSYETAKKAQPVDWYTGYYNIVVDNRNRKWVAVNGDWLGCLDGSVWTTYTVENGSLPFIIKRLLVDSRGRAWITSPISKYLAVLEGSSWTVFDRENSPLGPFDVFNISEGPDHSIWFISIKDIVRFIPRESSTGAERENTPNAFLTLHNHPNPFNPITTISFTLPRPGKTSLIVYDITGRKVRELISGVMSAGEYSVTWDGKDEDGKAVSSGLYIAYIESGGRAQSRKMQLMK